MLPLPPVPLLLGWRERVRLGRDYYVRLDASDYSVDPIAIGRMVDVTADLDRVRVRLEGRHGRRPCPRLGPRDHDHRSGPCRRPRAVLRHQFQQPRRAAGDDLVRDLADYDRAFGLIDGEVA